MVIRIRSIWVEPRSGGFIAGIATNEALCQYLLAASLQVRSSVTKSSYRAIGEQRTRGGEWMSPVVTAGLAGGGLSSEKDVWRMSKFDAGEG